MPAGRRRENRCGSQMRRSSSRAPRAGSGRHDRGMNKPQVVTVRGLRKAYGDRMVVDGLDLDVPAGEIWGGYPATPRKQWMRQQLVLARLAAPGAKAAEPAKPSGES